MTRSAFIRQARVATGARVLSATNEAGRTVVAPVPSTSNRGALQLRGSGSPTSSVVLDIALQTAGNVTGYALTTSTTSPGAAVRYKDSTAASDAWVGWVDPAFITWAGNVTLASATDDYPAVGRVRRLGNGSMGFARIHRVAAGADSVEFLYKATRSASWTVVSPSTATPDDASAPDIVVLDSGRVLLYYMLTDYTVRALYSDDHGATWATWSNNTNIGPLATGAKQLSVEAVDDYVFLCASMAPGATTRGATVWWSSNGGASFAQHGGSQTWGPARSCVTRSGEVLVIASNQSANAGAVWQVPRGAAPVGSALVSPVTVHALNVSPAIAAMDDGILWAFGGSTAGPTPLIEAAYSDDDGRTWRTPTSGTTLGVQTLIALDGTAAGWRSMSAGCWDGRVVLLLVTDGSTAAQDDSQQEIHLGGWDTLTEAVRTIGTDTPYARGYHPIDTPTTQGWTATNVGAGATTALSTAGWTITSTGVNNTYYTASTGHFPASGHSNGCRVKGAFSVTSGGSITDDRTLLFQVGFSDGGNEQTVKVRANTDQIRAVDGAGNVLGTSLSSANRFNAVHEYVCFFEKDSNAGATEGRVSIYFRAATATTWTALCTAAVVAETAGSATDYLLWGGTAAGASEWTAVWGPLIAEDDNDLGGGFTNPTDLAGRQVDAVRDFEVTAGHRLGGAGGAGVVGDTWTWTTDAQYHRRWIWSHLRPSQRHQATGDNATHEIVTDVGTNAPSVEYVALVGTNFRTASIAFNTADSWGSPPVEVALDATIWQGTVASAGLGYVRVDGAPFTPRQWQSQPLRRYFLETSAAVYEVTGNTGRDIEVEGVDLSAVTGTIRVFGDRMGAFLPEARYRYSKIKATAQQTADDVYRVASYLMGTRLDLTYPIANGFVDVYDPIVETTATETGQRTTAVRGTTPREFRIAFDPIDGMSSSLLRELRAFHTAVRGEHEVVGWLRDVDRPNDILLVQVFQPLTIENLYGNTPSDELARVAQLVLREVL